MNCNLYASTCKQYAFHQLFNIFIRSDQWQCHNYYENFLSMAIFNGDVTFNDQGSLAMYGTMGEYNWHSNYIIHVRGIGWRVTFEIHYHRENTYKYLDDDVIALAANYTVRGLACGRSMTGSHWSILGSVQCVRWCVDCLYICIGAPACFLMFLLD